MQKNGFTIMEFLIVLTIMAILFGLASLNFYEIQNDAKASRASSDLKVLKIAVESYSARHGYYPYSITDILLDGNIVSILPTDIYNPSDIYKYCISPNKTLYAIWSSGKNKISSSTIIWDNKKPIPADSDDIGFTNGIPPNKNWN